MFICACCRSPIHPDHQAEEPATIVIEQGTTRRRRYRVCGDCGERIEALIVGRRRMARRRAGAAAAR